ncbi:MAG: hypothetical protein NZT92_16645 [Abditibacteriales bacterium]|nr:hypothetical protein [Abditibacteriales bacterium]MDW8367309.1 glycoside hydrolase family 2 protein [Abditibacteriales bacterium]
MKLTRTPLNTNWRVREARRENVCPSSQLDWIPAQVPGHVHLDLMRAGVIADPFHRLNERGAAWVDETDWVYETTFTVSAEQTENAFLVFHGLDTVAEITLNGAPLGQTDNMFIPHEFNVSGRLCLGENTLQVVFRSALRVGRERQQAWADAGNDTLPPDWFVWGPRSFIRKAQYMFGWDWGPELVSCGLWRPVELVNVPVARLLDWRYDVEFTPDDKAIVRIEAFIERMANTRETPLTLTAEFTGVSSGEQEFDDPLPPAAAAPVPVGEGRIGVALSLTIDHPRRWNPIGHNAEGDRVAHPALYTLHLSLDAGKCVDERTAKIGLRTIELIREPDPDGRGESFKFRVNGADLFIKGANWIPADSFPSRLEQEAGRTVCPDDDRVRQLLFAACDAGINMLRVWGGGLYESEHFYELCDAHGILVWQDFPYACAYYPDTGEYAEAARHEATAAVRRLRVHPSLALWCGNNENHQMFHDGWTGKRPPRFLGEKLYHEILPAVIAAEDPTRPYVPGSPYGGDNPNSEDCGDRHNWNVWHGVGDWTHYPEDRARFCSEFGFASSCGLTAWDKCLADSDKWVRSPAVRWHDKTRKGYDTYLGLIRLHFPDPQTLEDLVYYSQLNQAEALKCGVEHYRRLKGRCWGTLFWQWNDCWPVQSWSVIDSEGAPKAAYYFAKKFYAPVLLSLVRQGNVVEAHLTNDFLAPVQGKVTLALETFEGVVLTEEVTEATVGANGTARVATLDIATAQGSECEVFVYARFEPHGDLGSAPSENFLFLAEPQDLRLADPGVEVRVEEKHGAFIATLTAQRFAPYVWVRLDGRARLCDHPAEDNFFHLRAGESKTLLIEQDSLLQTMTIADVRGRLRVRTL